LLKVGLTNFDIYFFFGAPRWYSNILDWKRALEKGYISVKIFADNSGKITYDYNKTGIEKELKSKIFISGFLCRKWFWESLVIDFSTNSPCKIVVNSYDLIHL